MHTLENDFLKIAIHPKGAELQRLYNKKTNTELLWSGDANYWGKYSPILFPIVGSLKENTYFVNDKPYILPRHGFARDKNFELKEKTANSISFLLKEDEETLKVYPFHFLLTVTYTLDDNKMTCAYNVDNTGTEEMYFSIGAHPAFAINGQYEDYYLLFNKDEQLDRYSLLDGLISENVEPIHLKNKQLQLLHSLFYKDAIVLKELQSTSISICNNEKKCLLDFQFENFPFFGIWASKNAPFVCLEPWCGIADTTTHKQQLINKEGIHKLPVNTAFQRSWTVKCN